MGALDKEEFEKRAEERLEEILDRELSFILDASIDRIWDKYKERFDSYDVFVISIDISKKLLKQLYQYKGYEMNSERIDRNHQDHINFLKEYSESVDIHITDKDFNNRLEIALDGAKEWYNS